MIAKFLSAIQTLVLIAVLIAGAFVTYQGYRVYRAVSERLEQVDAWIKRFSDQERQWFRLGSRIEKLEVERDLAKQKKEKIEAAKLPLKPTVIMYSMDGCGPCETWWREQAEPWRLAGWAVRRETSTTSEPTPYWDVWDGEKWFRVAGKLNLESYRSAGGK
jgi:hypothetical protein